jgi:hypothetical protein
MMIVGRSLNHSYAFVWRTLSVFWWSLAILITITCHSCDDHSLFLWRSLASLVTITLQSYDDHLPFVWRSLAILMTFTCQSCDDHLPFLWRSVVVYVKITRLFYDNHCCEVSAHTFGSKVVLNLQFY